MHQVKLARKALAKLSPINTRDFFPATTATGGLHITLSLTRRTCIITRQCRASLRSAAHEFDRRRLSLSRMTLAEGNTKIVKREKEIYSASEFLTSELERTRKCAAHQIILFQFNLSSLSRDGSFFHEAETESFCCTTFAPKRSMVRNTVFLIQLKDHSLIGVTRYRKRCFLLPGNFQQHIF